MCIVPEHQFKYIVPVNYRYLKYSSHVEYICLNILGLMGFLLLESLQKFKKKTFSILRNVTIKLHVDL